jgi:hypothetical protein
LRGELEGEALVREKGIGEWVSECTREGGERRKYLIEAGLELG